MAIEIQCCPFCGSDDVSLYEGLGGVCVNCWKCHASGPIHSKGSVAKKRRNAILREFEALRERGDRKAGR